MAEEEHWEKVKKEDMNKIVSLLAQAIVDIVDEEKIGWASINIDEAKGLMDKHEGNKK